MAIQVTTTDTETGETETQEVPPNGYVVVVTGRRYVDGYAAYKNGTVVITTKLDDRRGTS